MSLYDYQESQKISAQDPPFYALIMAAFRKADSRNHWKLRRAFPHAWYEFKERHDAPGGRLGEELLEQIVEELPKTILGRKVVIKEAGPRHVNLVLGDFDFYDWFEDTAHPLEKYFGPEEGYWEEELDGA